MLASHSPISHNDFHRLLNEVSKIVSASFVECREVFERGFISTGPRLDLLSLLTIYRQILQKKSKDGFQHFFTKQAWRFLQFCASNESSVIVCSTYATLKTILELWIVANEQFRYRSKTRARQGWGERCVCIHSHDWSSSISWPWSSSDRTCSDRKWKYLNRIVRQGWNSMNSVEKISFVLLLMFDDDQAEEFVNKTSHLIRRISIRKKKRKRFYWPSFFWSTFNPLMRCKSTFICWSSFFCRATRSSIDD